MSRIALLISMVVLVLSIVGYLFSNLWIGVFLLNVYIPFMLFVALYELYKEG